MMEEGRREKRVKIRNREGEEEVMSDSIDTRKRILVGLVLNCFLFIHVIFVSCGLYRGGEGIKTS